MISLSLFWLLVFGSSGPAQEAKPTEYQIKAAFLFNFAKFIQWPPSAFSRPAAPLLIGILGENPFHDDLSRVVQSKSVDEHPISVVECHSTADAIHCHILFISSSERNRLPEIIRSLKGTCVLTVAEMDHFTENGGMINFFLDSTKIRFEINNDAAANAGLRISSKLLALAVHPRR